MPNPIPVQAGDGHCSLRLLISEEPTAAFHNPDPSFDLYSRLCRPVVFERPRRVVRPPSWLEHIPFAFWIVEAMKPRLIVELGTHTGNSYAALAQAVQSLGLATACYSVDTWKGDRHSGHYDERVFAEWREYHDRHFAGFSRLMRSTFSDAVDHFADGSIDLLHLDGCHTFEAIEEDFETWLPKVSQRGVVLVHDINVREGDFGAWRLWQRLERAYPSFAFLHCHGLGVLGVGHELPSEVDWLLHQGSDSTRDVGEIRRFFSSLGRQISVEDNERRLVEACVSRDRTIRDLESSLVEALDKVDALESLAGARQRRDAGFRSSVGISREVARLAMASGSWRVRLRSLFRCLMHPLRARDAYLIARSGLFDPAFYLRHSPDVARSGIHPVLHYTLWGALERRPPSPRSLTQQFGGGKIRL